MCPHYDQGSGFCFKKRLSPSPNAQRFLCFDKRDWYYCDCKYDELAGGYEDDENDEEEDEENNYEDNEYEDDERKEREHQEWLRTEEIQRWQAEEEKRKYKEREEQQRKERERVERERKECEERKEREYKEWLKTEEGQLWQVEENERNEKERQLRLIEEAKEKERKKVRRVVLIILSILFGGLGVDRFFAGRIGLGILKLITFGGFGLWWLIDVILAFIGKQKDSNGLYI